MSHVAEQVVAAFADTATPSPPAGLFADGAVTWHGFDEIEAPTVPDTFDTLRAIRGAVADFTMTDVRPGPEDATVSTVRYVIVGTLPDGSRLRAPAAMVVHVVDGRATRVEEYIDTGQLAALFAALG